ncbi:unknown [Sinorhizobium phage PBC5]|uniref:hypothetical protein n=1 Tax=Sinorhizobium phage PBC5 TaxID=179237 RepID=UPI000009B8F5|nr:hypothetical protein PBC5_gp15 [Sinorhizobium phage PBC5]AAL49604.1 unknown [Sinorhizobium phage PBC5]
MELHEVLSVEETNTAGVFLALIDWTDNDGGRNQELCGLVPNDTRGVAGLVHAWLAENPNFPISPYTPPTPEQIRETMPDLSARQLRLVLIGANIMPAQVNAVIAAMPEGPDKAVAMVEWEYATTFRRVHPLLETVGGALGLTPEQIDTMWISALSL